MVRDPMTMPNKKTRGAPAKEDREEVLDKTIPVTVSARQKALLQEAAGRVPLSRWIRDHLIPIAEREIAEAKR